MGKMGRGNNTELPHGWLLGMLCSTSSLHCQKTIIARQSHLSTNIAPKVKHCWQNYLEVIITIAYWLNTYTPKSGALVIGMLNEIGCWHPTLLRRGLATGIPKLANKYRSD
ncbi:hypothetical protein H113_02295 [Trichophyton rubrum MR1459]|uniref:Uncharacterized protein n=1 Tax=Trichophyton rubrum (strain ATCC MYA-4607 / CBS 118892) TaxID=559305 RepID=F2SU99_TRIRC|nr:uncharacterized protein TERG_06048 [Trichophyton rubrum CBS 118892]EZF86978.1 hypothetical protein H110_02289 [Trichophyton rubrum MR1448]EZF97781.1 hypothetical protein H113_02295 [Trichophyton rubrum MR1459]EZG08683.1 hypothetical protein H106_02156 [Trichophyton rubrum CBS 735.88]EZG19298.1 hypothetical protein H107_02363 [Trichophyton rubrum CBS 202.88]EGD89811.1 hypothetical protein TERG_06048 [Trichophyton rubrum CBS 118892]